MASLACQAGEINHSGVSNTDKFLLCARSTLEKPVIQAWEKLNLPPECPETKDLLFQVLRERGITAFEDDRCVFLVRSDLTVPDPASPLNQLWFRWKRVRLVPTVTNWDSIPGSRNLTAVEQEEVGSAVFNQARSVPLVVSYDPGPDGESVEVPYDLILDVHRLTPSGNESVIAILGQRNSAGRLVYGELEDGAYKPLWDSPLFSTRGLQIGYEDVDGDGTKEILVTSDYGMRRSMLMLTIFGVAGEELTRQAPCEFDVPADEVGVVCPITADEINLEPSDGRKDIIVKGRIEDVAGPLPYSTYRYRLVNGRYVAEQE